MSSVLDFAGRGAPPRSDPALSSPTFGRVAQEGASLLYFPRGVAPQIAPTGPGCVPIALFSSLPLLRPCSPPPCLVAPPPEAGQPSPFLRRTLAPAGVVQRLPPRLLLAAPLLRAAGALPAGPLPLQALALPGLPRMAPLARRPGSQTPRLPSSLCLGCLALLPLVAAVPPVSRKSPRQRRH